MSVEVTYTHKCDKCGKTHSKTYPVYQGSDIPKPPAKFTEELRQRINNAGFSDEFKQQIKSAQLEVNDDE